MTTPEDILKKVSVKGHFELIKLCHYLSKLEEEIQHLNELYWGKRDTNTEQTTRAIAVEYSDGSLQYKNRLYVPKFTSARADGVEGRIE